VWFSVLPLAFGVLSAAVPVSALGTGAAVAVCFSPEEDCTALAVDAIDRAETQILVNAYGLTTRFKHRRGTDPGKSSAASRSG